MGTKKEIKIKGGKTKMYVNPFACGVVCGWLFNNNDYYFYISHYIRKER